MPEVPHKFYFNFGKIYLEYIILLVVSSFLWLCYLGASKKLATISRLWLVIQIGQKIIRFAILLKLIGHSEKSPFWKLILKLLNINIVCGWKRTRFCSLIFQFTPPVLSRGATYFSFNSNDIEKIKSIFFINVQINCVDFLNHQLSTFFYTAHFKYPMPLISAAWIIHHVIMYPARSCACGLDVGTQTRPSG